MVAKLETTQKNSHQVTYGPTRIVTPMMRIWGRSGVNFGGGLGH